MQIQSLSGAWRMRQADTDTWHEALVPGSVYADLLRDGSIPDPYWRENERECFELMRKEWEYTRTFDADKALLNSNRVVLRCFGLDTLATLTLNGVEIGRADNMHITWGFDVKAALKEKDNVLTVRFASPVEYCLAEYEKRPIWGSTDAIPGFGHLRKAHCMFGWDWGPRLPDAGIWREIRLEGIDQARLESVYVEQVHRDGKVTLNLRPDIDGCAEGCTLEATLTAPDGTVTAFEGGTLTVEHPQLWWPNGLGEHPLYTVNARLVANGREQDTWTGRIGLRTLTVSREKDEWGEEFCQMVNGVKVFAMGSDYIPEDNLLSRVTPERTRRLLEDAALANQNTIRVWGGGYYPNDDFFDSCDELGLMVWQDLMYACSLYELTPEFDASIRTEAMQNIRRIRHHASLAILSGNNEDEQFVSVINDILTGKQLDPGRFGPAERKHVKDYLTMYEYILSGIAKEEAPQTFWWPSSPSSGGSFDNPQDPNRGDVHYWDVWHGEKPFTEYRKFHFRYASEFGFQSFPMLPTIESFTEPEDRNIFSRVMERHQRNKDANGKILSYLSQTFRYPNSFDNLLYASQLLQAEAIRYGVEHWRRYRGRCMGAIVWQLNDIWPVASWASIDYYGRWKALHYAEKRFFAPVLLSIEEDGELNQNPKINEWHPDVIHRAARMNVSNETMQDVDVTVHWALRRADASIIREGEKQVHVPAMTAVWLDKLEFDDASITGSYFSCEMYRDGKWVSSSTALFCAPKHFEFINPHITCETDGQKVTVKADAYARQVWLESDDPDLLLSDNAFDMNAGEVRVRVLRGDPTGIRARSVWNLDHNG